MIIDISKEINELVANVAPFGVNGNLSIHLTDTATSEVIVLEINPSYSSNRYIKFELPEVIAEGIYNYELVDENGTINKGFLKVYDSSEEGVITPQKADESAKKVVFYNGRKNRK